MLILGLYEVYLTVGTVFKLCKYLMEELVREFRKILEDMIVNNLLTPLYYL